MLPELLVPETVARQDGVGAVLELESSGSPWLLTLNITRILEHESLEVTVTGSPDCEHWLPLAKFPRKFHCGSYAQWLDIGTHPGVRYLRVEWQMSRWGPSDSGVLSAFNVSAEPAKAMHAGA
jgi:hypothetical protein